MAWIAPGPSHDTLLRRCTEAWVMIMTLPIMVRGLVDCAGDALRIEEGTRGDAADDRF